MELQVTPQNYDESNPCTPTFTLAAIPELTQGQTYGVELDGVQAQPLEGNTYTPDASGSYRFVVLDEAGEVLARSRAWTVTLSSGADTVLTATPTAEPAANSTATPTVEPAVEPTATLTRSLLRNPRLHLLRKLHPSPRNSLRCSLNRSCWWPPWTTLPIPFLTRRPPSSSAA